MSHGAHISGGAAPLGDLAPGAAASGPFRILCAVDACLPAAPAFEQALAMSVSRAAQLVVVHALENRPYSWGAVERVSVLSTLRDRADALDVPVRIRTQQGDTAGVILLHAGAQAPDLIELGSHEPIGLARYRFESIVDRVVRGATCPVLLVPTLIAHATPSFSNVMCAVDLSSRSSAMVEEVSRVVDGGGRLTLLHIIDDSDRPRRRQTPPEPADPASHVARQRLQSMLEMQQAPADVLVAASSTSVDEAILRLASETTADLILMGAARRPGLCARFLGSTAIRVSRRSPIPVMILPAEHVRRTLSTLDQAALGWAA